MGTSPATLQGIKKLQLVGKQYMLPKDFKKIPVAQLGNVASNTYLASLK
jgi:hypothetical protein